MIRIINPGTAMGYTRKGSPIRARMFCEINYTDGKLSITGVVGPTRGGDAYGSCGQIVDTEILDFAPGWDAELLARFYEVWHRWHLNDMRVGARIPRVAARDYRNPSLGLTLQHVGASRAEAPIVPWRETLRPRRTHNARRDSVVDR